MATKNWPIRHGDHEVELTRMEARSALNVFARTIWALRWLSDALCETGEDRPIWGLAGQLIDLPILDACMQCVVGRRGSYAFICRPGGAEEVDVSDPETFQRIARGYAVIGRQEVG